MPIRALLGSVAGIVDVRTMAIRVVTMIFEFIREAFLFRAPVADGAGVTDAEGV